MGWGWQAMSARLDPIALSVAANQYDLIAGQYQRSRHSPIRQYVESYSLFTWLGDLAGRSVLDLACGEGHYTRRIRERGARRVLGVDISSAMIDLARAQGAGPGGIEYQVHDVQDLPPLGPFDLVCAAYLLHYARDVAELYRMCRSIARQLPSGGRFVTINENPEQPEDAYAGYLRYGFSKSVTSPRREASPITYAMISGRELFRFVVYHFERDTYEQALQKAGFTDIRWHALQLDPAGGTRMGNEYWSEYLANPPIVGLSCRRAG
jgi:ubiquinone/menaquinone biosynthesis C-methylase UbiE